jgi:Flp pilus assembly secretin CpaC
MNTTVRLNDGQTLVLGGLIKNEEGQFAHKIPILGDIPIIGYLFKYSGRTQRKTNLVIYITPHIVTLGDTVNLAKELRNSEIDSRPQLEKNMMEGFDNIRESKKERAEKRKSERVKKALKSQVQPAVDSTAQQSINSPSPPQTVTEVKALVDSVKISGKPQSTTAPKP